MYFEGGFQDTLVYLLKGLRPGQQINGPAIIMDKLSTILIEPDCKGSITRKGDIKIIIGNGKLNKIGKELDSIQLSIFGHRCVEI